MFVRALGTEATTSTTAARFSITLSTTSRTQQSSLPCCCHSNGRKYMAWDKCHIQQLLYNVFKPNDTLKLS